MSIFWFVVMGFGGVLALLVTVMLRWNRTLVVSSAILVVAILALALHSFESKTLGDRSWLNSTPIRESILFVLMLLGMGARELSLAIDRMRKKNADSPKITKWDFVYPMCFSIPTFAALLTQLPADSLTTPSVILAFQTGFFWQTVLKTT